MKKLLSILILLFFGICSDAQKSSILYYLPDSVEIQVNQYISKQQNKPNFYFKLKSDTKDTFNLVVCQFKGKEKKYLESWIFLTNRKVVVSKGRYPLLLDYDYKFSTLDTLRVGSYGDRANKIVRHIAISHCYSIKFTKYYILDSNNKAIGYANRQHIEE